MQYIHELKNEDKNQLLEIRKNWEKNLINTTNSINKEKIEKEIISIFQYLNTPEPLQFIYLQSPLQIAISACYLQYFRYRPQFLYSKKVWKALWNKFWYELELDFHELSHDCLWREEKWYENDDENIDEDVNLEIEELLTSSYNDLRNSLVTQLLEKIWSTFEQDNWNELVTYTLHTLKKQGNNEPGKLLGWSFGNHESSWICENLFKFRGFNIHSLNFSEFWYKLTFETGWWIAFENIVLISERPHCINLNENFQLHANGKKSIEFSDGWGIYSAYGVQIPDKWGNIPFKEWKPEWLLETKNVEHRMALLKAIGYEKVMNELGSRIIHQQKDSSGNIMELHRIEYEIDIEPIMLLKVVCPSTSKVHILRVPPYMCHCEIARRWTLFDEKNNFKFYTEA